MENLKSKKSNILLLALSLVLSLVLGACDGSSSNGNSSSNSGNNGDGSSSAAEELKIGVVAPLSGAGAAWGIAVQAGAEIAADEINEQGGLEVNGVTHKVKVIPYDSEYTAQGVVTATNRLVNIDKVNFIVGPIESSGIVPMQEVTEPNKVIIMSDTFTPKALSPEKPFTFRVEPTAEEMAGPMIRWMKENYSELKTVAIISPNDETGWDMEEQINQAYVAEGYEIVDSIFYERGTQDFSTILSKLIQMQPDILELGGSSPGDSSLIVKQIKELGFKGQLVKIGGEATKEILQVTGPEALEGFLHYTPTDPNEPGIAELTAKFEAKYNGVMPGTTTYFYDGTHLLFQAIKEAGTTTDTEGVAQALRKIETFEGVLGKSFWTGMDSYGINQQLMTSIYVGLFENGQVTAVQVQ
ncbi:ABC transporter substrate-binding protein [Bacillus sp. FJAT-50079]|uniref:ABC transporter substrate-binding protein n=1 Tax=Bacillus sp. FJAT-50079 TaxID=2833577 RepID=UPI001BC960DD|nr:ABC transporter substrate-binding protein [Bacillus sp. FJAT-50079]MBS4210585.1 ABC transporter substrate-binding protein [Bacillus sp. FJAT-50079]